MKGLVRMAKVFAVGVLGVRRLDAREATWVGNAQPIEARKRPARSWSGASPSRACLWSTALAMTPPNHGASERPPSCASRPPREKSA